jgi:hypothetical protein
MLAMLCTIFVRVVLHRENVHGCVVHIYCLMTVVSCVLVVESSYAAGTRMRYCMASSMGFLKSALRNDILTVGVSTSLAVMPMPLQKRSLEV